MPSLLRRELPDRHRDASTRERVERTLDFGGIHVEDDVLVHVRHRPA